jgi:hypothetical protein
MTATLSAFGPKETMARLHEAVIAHDGKEVLARVDRAAAAA